LRSLDLAVIVLYLAGITWFGARFRRTQKSLRDYFLGGRTAPWWAIALSIVSAETSTLTIIGTPTLAFTGDLRFLQVVFGYLLARLVISAALLPHYFRGEMFTAYELMERRFGPRLRRLTAAAFLAIRSLAEGVRVFAIALVISIVLGSGETVSIAVIVCLTLFYTFEGGMTAVIWTGAVVSFATILQHIPGGWEHVAAVAGPAGKLRVFDFTPPWTPGFFTIPFTFWAGLVGGCFLTTASHGTEQLMVQRLLAARSQRDSRTALIASWAVIFVQFTLFLLIGVALAVFYQDNAIAAPKVADQIYPQFVWNYLPPGVAGLVIAAVLAAAMSNLSAALNSLASTTVMDILRPLAGKKGAERNWLRWARVATVVWGAVLFGLGALAREWGPVLTTGLTVASIAYGGLLGVFLLGTLTRRVGERAAMIGMAAGLAAEVAIWQGTPIAWTWYVAIGTSVTFLTACLASLLVTERSHE
jgi:SSS family solute:Na+ symporter